MGTDRPDSLEDQIEAEIAELISALQTYNFEVWPREHVEDICEYLLRLKEEIQIEGTSHPWVNVAKIFDSFGIDPRIPDPVTTAVGNVVSIYNGGL
jgi:hypothetical protein